MTLTASNRTWMILTHTKKPLRPSSVVSEWFRDADVDIDKSRNIENKAVHEHSWMLSGFPAQ